MILEVGDPVEVLDVGLAQIRILMSKFGADPGPNNIGTVAEILDNGETILVEFPIGDDAIEEHSQVSPYPVSKVRLIRNDDDPSVPDDSFYERMAI